MAAGGARATSGILWTGIVWGSCAALLLAGCSSAEPEPPASVAAGDELEAYLEPLFSGLDVPAQLREQQDVIAACMTDLGFEYVPTLAGQGISGTSSPTPAELEAFRLTDGWGVTANSMGEPVPWDGEMILDPKDTGANPNTKTIDALSSTAREAYVAGLIDCEDTALATVSIEGALADRPDLAALYDEVIALRFDESDPRWRDLDARWARCMEDAGHPGYTTASMVSMDFENTVGGPDRPRDPGAVEEQRAQEVTAAAADHECRTELDYDAITTDIRETRNVAFLTEHKDELDAMMLLVHDTLPQKPEPTP